jgi:hypothetical protein
MTFGASYLPKRPSAQADEEIEPSRVDVYSRASETACNGAHLGVGVRQEWQDSHRGQLTTAGPREADRNLQRRPLHHATIQQSGYDYLSIVSADRSERVERNRFSGTRVRFQSRKYPASSHKPYTLPFDHPHILIGKPEMVTNFMNQNMRNNRIQRDLTASPKIEDRISIEKNPIWQMSGRRILCVKLGATVKCTQNTEFVF